MPMQNPTFCFGNNTVNSLGVAITSCLASLNQNFLYPPCFTTNGRDVKSFCLAFSDKIFYLNLISSESLRNFLFKNT